MEALKRRRAALRTKVTNLFKKIERDLKENPEDEDDFEVTLAELKRLEENLTQLDSQIETRVEEENLDAEFTNSDEYQEKMTAWKTRLEIRIRKGRNVTTGIGSTSGTETEGGKRAKSIPSLKLPRLTIEKFTGDSSCWQTFWAQYSTAVHTNQELNQIDKFNYLKSFVGGTAAKAIAGLPITETNYEMAITILMERFGRQDLVINSHINRLLDLTPVKKSSDLKALRELFDDCQLQVRSLMSMGLDSSTYGNILCPILLKVLPTEIVLEYNKSRADDSEWNIEQLLEFLRKDIESRERTKLVTRNYESNEPSTKGNGKSNFNNEKTNKQNKGVTASAAFLNTANTTKCFFCESTEHVNENCKTKSTGEKKDIIRQQGRCFLCLRKNHRVRDCKTRNKCSVCQRRHHTTICDEVTEPNSETKSGKELSSTVVTSLCQAPNTSNILYLQTLQVVAKGRNTSLTLRGLMDSGSHRSYIREDISRKMNLPVVGEECLKIYAFGSKEPTQAIRRRVKVVLQNFRDPKKFLEIEALETPEICSALVQTLSAEVKYLLKERGLDAADEGNAGLDQVDHLSLIIGSDSYWKVGKNRAIKRFTNSFGHPFWLDHSWTVPSFTEALQRAFHERLQGNCGTCQHRRVYFT